MRASLCVALAVLLAQAPALTLQIGGVAPEFAMTTLEGRRFSLAEAEKTHSGVVILFLSTICPYANYYNDLIRDMAGEFGKRGVLFVGVNSGKLETIEEVRTHAREHGHDFDIIKDPDSRIAELLDARRTPEVFLLDYRGTLRYHGRIASKISSPDLKSAIEALLAGRPIRPGETKAFGCTIPRS
ncbi:MAG: redoxin domain-containing protein [Acidobacteriota bacterium]|nr:redoxin domain-containing protein [Acidobacteriota bacterium]